MGRKFACCTCLSFDPKVVGSGLTFTWNHIIGNLGTASMSTHSHRFSLGRGCQALTVDHLSSVIVYTKMDSVVNARIYTRSVAYHALVTKFSLEAYPIGISDCSS